MEARGWPRQPSGLAQQRHCGIRIGRQFVLVSRPSVATAAGRAVAQLVELAQETKKELDLAIELFHWAFINTQINQKLVRCVDHLREDARHWTQLVSSHGGPARSGNCFSARSEARSTPSGGASKKSRHEGRANAEQDGGLVLGAGDHLLRGERHPRVGERAAHTRGSPSLRAPTFVSSTCADGRIFSRARCGQYIFGRGSSEASSRAYVVDGVSSVRRAPSALLLPSTILQHGNRLVSDSLASRREAGGGGAMS
jgi:hypothetical protein